MKIKKANVIIVVVFILLLVVGGIKFGPDLFYQKPSQCVLEDLENKHIEDVVAVCDATILANKNKYDELEAKKIAYIKMIEQEQKDLNAKNTELRMIVTNKYNEIQASVVGWDLN